MKTGGETALAAPKEQA